jgi:hypothetical protein
MPFHPPNKDSIIHVMNLSPNSTKKKVWAMQKYGRNKRCHAKEA